MGLNDHEDPQFHGSEQPPRRVSQLPISGFHLRCPESQQTHMKGHLYTTDAIEIKSVKKAEVGQAGWLRCLPTRPD